jgi:hypothetical protein
LRCILYLDLARLRPQGCTCSASAAAIPIRIIRTSTSDICDRHLFFACLLAFFFDCSNLFSFNPWRLTWAILSINRLFY